MVHGVMLIKMVNICGNQQNNMRFFLFPLLLIFVATTKIALASESKKLMTGLNHKRAPYSYVENGKLVGLDVEIADEVFSLLDYESHYIDISHARGIKLLEERELDYTVGVIGEGRNNQNFWHSRPYRSELITVVVRRTDKDKYILKEFEDILRYDRATIAARRGAWLGEKFDEFLKSEFSLNKKIVFLPRTAQRLRLLLSNRVDFLIGDKYALLYTAKKMGLENEIHITDLVINRANVCYLFDNTNLDQDFKDELDLAITKVWASEKYFDLFDKYR